MAMLVAALFLYAASGSARAVVRLVRRCCWSWAFLLAGQPGLVVTSHPTRLPWVAVFAVVVWFGVMIGGRDLPFDWTAE